MKEEDDAMSTQHTDKQPIRLAKITARTDGNMLLFDETAMNAAIEAIDATVEVLKMVTVAVAEGGQPTAFVRFGDILKCGTVVESADGPAVFSVPKAELLKSVIVPRVDELDITERGKPPGAVFLNRVSIEDVVRAGDSGVRVEIVRTDGQPSVIVAAIDLLLAGCYIRPGDPLWPGCDTRAIAPIHSTTTAMLCKLATLPAVEPDTPVAWSTGSPSPKKAKMVEVDEEVRDATPDSGEAVVSGQSLPAPLALLRKLDDPFGCAPAQIPRAELEDGVRSKLRALLVAMRSPGFVPLSTPTTNAEHVAWQILHGVVLSTAEGANLRHKVRKAERTAIYKAIGPCKTDAAVDELSKRTKALALLTEKYGGPFTPAQVAEICGIEEAALPAPGPPGCKYYCVPFELALPAMGSKLIMLHDGNAYVLASDIPDVLAVMAEDLSHEVEHTGFKLGLGDAFVEATAGKGPELPYYRDATVMDLTLQNALHESKLVLGTDADTALRSAPACVHAMLFACSTDGRLAQDARIEALRCLIDCGFDNDAAAETISSLMNDTGRHDCPTKQLVALARSYAKFDGPKSKACAVLQRPWNVGVVCSIPAACPYPYILNSVSHLGETQQDMDKRLALKTAFLAWLAVHSAATDVEDLCGISTPFKACRCHAAKLVQPQRIPEANVLNIRSPADFLKFVFDAR
jgi:hypothetical protein